MGNVQIGKDPVPPAPSSLPERAWIQQNQGEDRAIYFNIHKYNKEFYQREDVMEMFYLDWIDECVLTFGPRGGFKGLVLKLNAFPDAPEYKISKTHQVLAKEIALILNKEGVKVGKIKG